MNAMYSISGGLALLWLFLACFLPRRSPVGQARLVAGMIAIGVPILGWLTLHWGPAVGICAFAAGLGAILHRNRQDMRENIDQGDDGADLSKRALR
ncbi:DUF2484 family protein [Paracoccus onubensis]|uniref:DUF2484 family protein n=1 Tax=Paracoccus onubensis TaxID=1675788 RepID=A0A418SZX2_9RHOB|nr:DUF2484 family protein [Paracoccus onubensis]RJE86484.1 DUF2484 family protein [Paracoccus onubensis]